MRRIVSVQGFCGLIAAKGAALVIVKARPQASFEESRPFWVDADGVVVGDFVLESAFNQPAKVPDFVVGHVHGSTTKTD